MLKRVVSLIFLPVLLLSILMIRGVASPQTIVYVAPEEIMVKVGQTFTVDVNITGVSGLQGFDFSLSYNTTILDGLEVVEGPFLASFGPTFVVKLEIDDEFSATQGRVWVVIVVYGDGFADGNGTLATITFNATASGECALDLYSDYPFKPDELKLVTCGPEPIPHKVVDGTVVVSSNPDDPLDPPNPDLNGDETVDLKDVFLAAKAYGTSKGEYGYNPCADLDQNDVIDISDLIEVAQNLDWSC